MECCIFYNPTKTLRENVVIEAVFHNFIVPYTIAKGNSSDEMCKIMWRELGNLEFRVESPAQL